MAREIVTHSWCDVCLADDVREPGAEVVAQVGKGTKLKALDLCERHRKEIVEPLAELLAEHGRVADASPVLTAEPATIYRKKNAKSIAGPFVCQVPSCKQTRPFASASSLSWHVRAAHEPMSFAEYRDSYGLTRAQLTPDEQAAFDERVARRKRRTDQSSESDEHDDPLDLPIIDRAAFAEKKRLAVGLEATSVDSLAPSRETVDGGTLSEDDSKAFDCPHCDKSYPSAKYSRPAQALGVHLAMAHDIRSQKSKGNLS